MPRTLPAVLVRRLVFTGAALVLMAACHRNTGGGDALRSTLASPVAPHGLKLPRWKLLRQIYADRQYRPLWVQGSAPTDRVRELVATLCGAEREGLRPEDYDLAGLRRAMEQVYGSTQEPAREAEAEAALELRLTALLLDYGADLLAGRLDPRVVDDGWYITARRASVDSALRAAVVADGDAGIDRVIARLRPQQPEYLELLRALANERADAARPSGTPERRAAAERRLRLIELNLERYRWLPNSFGPSYIMVNIPEYQLSAYDGGKPALTMRVIVGDEYENATPVFADSMTQVVFRPRWNVPTRILVQEMVPKLRDDAEYLTRNNYEVVDAKSGAVLDPKKIDWDDLDTAKLDFRVRQKPGPGNPLGRVKFLFPNQFAIYLHDTPADELFNRTKRTLSHGCVRIEEPRKLAEFVLQDQDGWNDEKIRQAMEVGDSAGHADTSEQVVKLEHPIPVYIVYLTATARDGHVVFRDDPYHKDEQAIARLRPRRTLDPTICETLARLVGR